ncbi:ImmA/IrrE family metallo-endopeptidase [uncultured Methanobrevibacter sp.]|uniref:ImmA/IrrE family metallo-endopeptidase n=1 Tax=uncultured Methanobrevibacter sp. TaxID=253161 RepID=UPI0025FFCAC0|nr:ImmA/IrrE family metallo-endopeptidase [uncultured Methanobrevibacter sp.]
MNLYELNKLAIEFRSDIGLNQESPLDFFPVITNKLKNLTIVFLEMDEKISGACFKVDSQQIMFINSKHPKGRQVFTAAHELYHLFYEDAVFTICNLNSNDEIEKNANQFASFLLMPINALYSYKKENNIEKWNLNSIIDCEQYFQISHEALLYRLKNSSDITFEEFNKFKPNIKNNAQYCGYDSSLYEPYIDKNYTIGNYVRLVEEVYRKDLISNGKREEYLIQSYLSDLVYNLEDL